MLVSDANKFDDPTPETVAKLKPCSLGYLDSELQRAGYLIADAFAAITLGLQVKIGGLTTIGKGVMPVALTDHLAEKIIAYRKWVDEMARYRMDIYPVIDVCFDNMSCRDVAAKYRHDRGWASTLLKDALELYVKVNNG
jgi:hypothetical protein